MLTPGEILKDKRNEIGKTIFEVAQETRILEKYIKQIEANQFDQFDSPVFARGFIKIYAQYLNLDQDKVLALFRRTSKGLEEKDNKKKKRWFNNLDNSKNVKNILIAVTAVLFIIFGAFIYTQLYLYQLQPKLEVFTPVNGLVTEQESIKVEGLTNEKNKVVINGNEIENRNGSFSTDYKLTLGENVITVISENRRNVNKITQNVIKVQYNKPAENTEVPEVPILKSFNITVKVKSEASWVRLIIDQKQKIAQILNPNYSGKFKVASDFELVTGRPDMTEIYVNNEKKSLTNDTESGVASIKCSINNNEIVCPR